MIVRPVTAKQTNARDDTANDVLTAGGNLYRTQITVDGDIITLVQRNWLVALVIATMSLMFGVASQLIGLPLLLIALMYAMWQKQLTIHVARRQLEYRNGLFLLAWPQRASFDRVQHVTLRECVTRSNSSARARTAHWRSWDVTIYGLDGKLCFPVWEQGDDQQPRRVAQLLARLFDCPLKQVHPRGRLIRSGDDD